MSSISAQGVVERASAELSKRINGLGLRGSKHHSAKGSVMERVTNVFCGGQQRRRDGPREALQATSGEGNLEKRRRSGRSLRQRQEAEADPDLPHLGSADGGREVPGKVLRVFQSVRQVCAGAGVFQVEGCPLQVAAVLDRPDAGVAMPRNAWFPRERKSSSLFFLAKERVS
ncbi:hypothetical protein NQ317_019020 [Molorchus minor]|uniref:Uncharacterized protein n=1 Tax=Molorchus minor TaxID=1323400 RepID=A0ABQ9J559_9CUCU|nr:hypothetical protein NQ317_019020 [Molorchus minor]